MSVVSGQDNQAPMDQFKIDQAKKDATQTNNQAFFMRADEIITLANKQLSPSSHAGQVAASLTFAAARFAVSSASVGFIKGEDLAKEKDDIIQFYTKQYQQMLSDNIDDYAKNFSQYTTINHQPMDDSDS